LQSFALGLVQAEIMWRLYATSILNTLYELEKAGLRWRTKNEFEGGTIDSDHDFVRVTGSYNSWMEDAGVKRRKVIQYTIDEFRKLQIQDIIARSEVTN